jgi:hypothetical protein
VAARGRSSDLEAGPGMEVCQEEEEVVVEFEERGDGSSSGLGGMVFILPVIPAVVPIPLSSAVIRVLAVASSAFAFVVFGFVCLAAAFPSFLS